jgi:hypothetical protein
VCQAKNHLIAPVRDFRYAINENIFKLNSIDAASINMPSGAEGEQNNQNFAHNLRRR